MNEYICDLTRVDDTHIDIVGGKAAHLGELTRIDGVAVPAGFCVTTRAYRDVIADEPAIGDLIDALTGLTIDDTDAISIHSARLRSAIEAIRLPDGFVSSIDRALREHHGHDFAVRSSATAEDLPHASFAGQQDSYLTVTADRVGDHIRRCWASLFTERAVAYRVRNGFDHRRVDMAVIVQRMVDATAAGVLFTADPVTSNRRVSAIEASPGLGEAVVSGTVTPDVYRIRDDAITVTQIGDGPDSRSPVLSDDRAVELARLGRRIEAHFGSPQDIEWCLDRDGFQVVQARPITTLFPIPDGGEGDRVFVSVGHQQMMTDPMTPLGLSVWQLISPAPMRHAGGRLFVDVTQRLASPDAAESVIRMLGASDPLIGDALRAITDRGFVPPQVGGDVPPPIPEPPVDPDPAIVPRLVEQTDALVSRTEREIPSKSGSQLLDFILADIARMRGDLFVVESVQAIAAGIDALLWLRRNLQAWLGDESTADVLTQSVPGNVTSQMGLALLDVADVIRPYPELVEYLRQVDDDDFLDRLDRFTGGGRAREAIRGFLDAYGMRCIGEIDLTRTRWCESPTLLLPMLLANIANFEAGEAGRRFERGLAEAERAERHVLERLRELPDGESKAVETKRMIDRLRAFIGYREYPKYGMVRRTFAYKKALLDEADRLVAAGVLEDREDIFFLTFPELQGVVANRRADGRLIDRRRADFRSFHALMPPRVITSEGESVVGVYRGRQCPPGAIVGLPVSSGAVEGRARVILDIADAAVEPGDILVTRHTDPSWSPLFVTVSGLVTEVGGTMTHGSVIAREYGLPAVVGVEDATGIIPDGSRIRVDGTGGYIELLPDA